MLSLLLLISNLFATSAFAASYQKLDGTIVDRILDLTGFLHPYSGPDLGPGVVSPSANLVLANLHEADLRNANLRNVNLNRAYVISADLSNANLSNAILTRTVLPYTNLSGTNLTDADLTLSILYQANLSNAILRGANLTGADLFESDFTGASLANVVGICVGGQSRTYGCAAFYDARTDFTGAEAVEGTPFDPIAAGWTFVPEPSAAILLGFGLAGLGYRRRAG